MPFIKGQRPTAEEWNAAFDAKLDAGFVSTYSKTLLGGVTQAAWFTNLGLPASPVGSAGGLLTLDGSGKVALANIPDSIVGALYFKTTWNATTNNPALASGAGVKGDLYVVSVAGTTNLDGLNVWSVGDWAFFDGSIWRKVNASDANSTPSTGITDSTAAGRALLTAATVAAQRALLRIDQVDLVANADRSVTNVMTAVAFVSLTAGRTATLPAASTFQAGQSVIIMDESGSCSPATPITIAGSGGELINGASSFVLDKPFAGVIVIRGSASKWTALPLASYRDWITAAPPRRQTVNAGPVDSSGFPSLLPATTGALSISTQNVSTTNMLLVSAAGGAARARGQDNRNGISVANLTWSGLPASSLVFLYVLVGADGLLTTRFTTLAPIYQNGGVPSTVNGQFTFNISEMKGYLGNGSTAPQVYAVFVGEATTSGSAVTDAIAYAYNGRYHSDWTTPLTQSAVSRNSNLGIPAALGRLTLRCNSADNEYAVGDHLPGFMVINPNGAYFPAAVWVSRNQIGLAPHTSSAFAQSGKTSATLAALTLASWDYALDADRGW